MTDIRDVRTSSGQGSILRTPIVPYLRGSEDMAKALKDIEANARDVASILDILLTFTQYGASAPVIAMAKHDQGHTITQGKLVHLNGANVCELAVNSDPNLYATHVVYQVLASGRVALYSFGSASVKCINLQNSEETNLWLSSYAGFATDVEPTGDGVVVQRIGTKMDGQDTRSGLVYTAFHPEFYPTAEGGGGPEPEPFNLIVADGVGSVPNVNLIYFDGATVQAGNSGEAIVTIEGGGVVPVEATAGEAGIEEGMLVHVDSWGVAWKADANHAIRFATHYVSEVVGDVVYAVCLVNDAFVLVDDEDANNHTNVLYLSDKVAGYASPNPPDYDAGYEGGTDFKVWQKVGVAYGSRQMPEEKVVASINIEQAVML